MIKERIEYLKAMYRYARNSKLRTELKRNIKFKNIHEGKRCFVLGNGPSLKDVDLGLLENEYVFTVNKITNHNDFAKLKTNYHFWADPVFFQLSPEREEDMELLNSFLKIKTKDNNPICFLPYYAHEFVEQFGLEKELAINYYAGELFFYDDMQADIDFTKITYSYQTVVQYAIAMAIYMGFSEIYLLGCDTTGIIGTIEAYLGQEVTQYAYQVNDLEKRFLKNIVENRKLGMESDFIGWARILHLHRELYKYCLRKKILLVNCSNKTIIDSIPKESLSEVLKRKN